MKMKILLLLLCLLLLMQYIPIALCRNILTYNGAKPPKLISIFNDASTRYDTNSGQYAYQTMDIMSNEIQPQEQRPLYNIAHMANSIKMTSDALNRGANGVEVDVNFDTDNIYLYHGYPCDCFRMCWEREDLKDYLRFVRTISTPGSPKQDRRLAILYFDFKLKPFTANEKYTHGIRFGDSLAKNLFHRNRNPSVTLICSISYLDDANFVRGMVYRLRELGLFEHVKRNIGFDVGMEMDFEKSETLWHELNVTNVWQGEGITNCFNPIMASDLEKLVKERNRAKSRVKKVYRWTVDLTDSIKSILQFNIDGIMTNHPERVQKIINENGFSSVYRLATYYDNPFVKHINGHGHEKKMNRIVQSGARAANSVKMLNFLQDLRDSFFFFAYELLRSIF